MCLVSSAFISLNMQCTINEQRRDTIRPSISFCRMSSVAGARKFVWHVISHFTQVQRRKEVTGPDVQQYATVSPSRHISLCVPAPGDCDSVALGLCIYYPRSNSYQTSFTVPLRYDIGVWWRYSTHCVNIEGRPLSICVGYGLDGRSSIPGRGKDESFSLRHRVLTASGAHPASYPMGTGCYLGNKVDGT